MNRRRMPLLLAHRRVRSRLGMLVGLALMGAAVVPVVPAHADGLAAPMVLRDVQASTYDIPAPADGYALPIDGDHVQPDTQTEPSIAVNPSNPLNAVTAFQEGRIDSGGDADNGYATTVDGGKTWVHGYLPGLTGYVPHGSSYFERASDAVVAFGPDNTVYGSSLVFDQDTNSGLPSGMAVNVSTDGGLTWSAPVFLEQDDLDGLNDKNWIVVDNGTGPGHHLGRVYVVWDRESPMVYAYCDPDVVTSAVTGAGCDKADNWSNAPEHNGAFYVFSEIPGIGSIPMVLPDGSLGILYEGDFGGPPPVENPVTDQPDFSPGTTQLTYAVAPAAGAVPFPAPLDFTQASVGVASDQSTCCTQQRAGTLPAAAVDPSTGRIVVVWEDGRARTDGLNDILFSTSTDGITWTPAARINTDPEGDGVDHWNPMVDIAGGRIHVAYRTRVEKPALSNTVDTYYQESADDGATWTAPLQVNDNVSTDLRYAAFSRGGAFLGDYNQLAVGSNGWAWVVHNEAGPSYDGEPCNCSFTAGNGHQHQTTWVGIIAPSVAPSLPEVPWVASLLLAGIVVLAWSARRRRV